MDNAKSVNPRLHGNKLIGNENILRGAALLALLIALLPARLWAQSDLDCDGDRLDVLLGAGSDSSAPPPAVFEFPNSRSWLISMGQGKHLSDLPCQAEPIKIVSAWSNFANIPDIGEGDAEWASCRIIPHTLRISAPGRTGQQRREQSDQTRIDFTMTQGVDLGDGYRRIAGSNTDEVGGMWLLSDSHVAPLGRRVATLCTLTCNIEYRISEFATVLYDFRVTGRETRPNLVGIDRRTRSMATSWIRKG